MRTGAEGLATDADLEAILADVDREILEATDTALAAPKPAVETAISAQASASASVSP